MTFQKIGLGLAALSVVALCSAAFTQPTQASTETFKIIDLGAIGGTMAIGESINDANQVAGYTYVNNLTQAFFYTGSQSLKLGYINGADSSSAYCVNSVGVVVGTSGTHGFEYKSGKMIDLGALPGGTSAAYSVNRSGDIAGQAALPPYGFQLAYVMPSGTTTMDPLPTLGGFDSMAQCINDSGAIVGCSTTSDSESTHACLWTKTSGSYTATDIGTLGGLQSYALGINDGGLVTGWSYVSGTTIQHAFLWTSAHGMKDLGTLAAGASAYSIGYGTNKNGTVVGQSNGLGIMYRQGVMYDLNRMIPNKLGFQIVAAFAINDSGDIAADGLLNGKYESLILVPVWTN